MANSMGFGRIIVAAIVRTLVIAAIGWVVGWVFGTVTGGHDANIGAGLAAMAAVGLAIVVWAFRDGRAHGWLAMAIWILVGILNGGAWALLAAIQARGLQDVPAGPGQPVEIPAPSPFVEFVLTFAFFGLIPVVLSALAILAGVAARPQDGVVEAPATSRG